MLIRIRHKFLKGFTVWYTRAPYFKFIRALLFQPMAVRACCPYSRYSRRRKRKRKNTPERTGEQRRMVIRRCSWQYWLSFRFPKHHTSVKRNDQPLTLWWSSVTLICINCSMWHVGCVGSPGYESNIRVTCPCDIFQYYRAFVSGDISWPHFFWESGALFNCREKMSISSYS